MLGLCRGGDTKEVIGLILFLLAPGLGWGIEIKYPDPKITPGAADPRLTKEVICAEGFHTGDYRHVTQKMHREMFEAYGMDWDKDHACCEDDHLISIELGGTNNLKNRWPQPWPEAKEKDRVENYLHKQVCKNGMSLEEAQKEIIQDWYKIYQTISK